MTSPAAPGEGTTKGRGQAILDRARPWLLAMRRMPIHTPRNEAGSSTSATSPTRTMGAMDQREHRHVLRPVLLLPRPRRVAHMVTLNRPLRSRSRFTFK